MILIIWLHSVKYSKLLNSSIWPIDGTLIGTTTPGQSGPGSHGNKRVFYMDIGIMVRVFANDPGDQGSISGRVIPKTQKMVLDASLLNTQHYKVQIKGKVKQSRE